MQIQDDRTPEQKKTHPVLIVGTDKLLSGWGKAKGGTSYAAWACRIEDDAKVYRWVRSRSDMERVREAFDDGKTRYRPKGNGHLHIYLVGEGHPALKTSK